jgi:HSP20 family protein
MTTTTPSDTTTDNTRTARGCGPRGGGPRGGWRQAPVNIEETTDAFILSLYVAGLNKSGIQVSAQGDVLRIRYTAAQSEGSEGSQGGESARRFTRREMPHTGFEREFALNAKVQLEVISASYSEGVLTVRLPKTPDAMQPEHQVAVQ